uniref:VWFD domain-containing protein n=1 Tax=Haplochromis burtoni TaxID=8153 RepID=A0A3Q3CEG4_HAPBU
MMQINAFEALVIHFIITNQRKVHLDSLYEFCVELEQELSTDMTGLCGKCNVTGQQLIRGSTLTDDTCQTRDRVSVPNPVCEHFFSYTLSCLQSSRLHYFQLCHKNIYRCENSEHIGCAFIREIVLHCGKSSNLSLFWWMNVTRPTCPGALLYEEEGAAFVPTCSNPNPHFSSQDITSSCVCPEGEPCQNFPRV